MDRNMRKREWILGSLISAILFAIPYALFSSILLTSWIGLILLFVLPVLEGLLVWLLINWRAVYELWCVEKKLVSSLLVVLLLILTSTALGNIYITLLVTLPALFTALVWMAGSRIGLGGLAAVAILLAVFLILDAIGLASNHFVFNNPNLRAAYEMLSGLAALLALVLAGMCVYRALEGSLAGNRHTVKYLILAGLLLLSVGAVTLRSGILTNATGRAFEDHFPLAAFACALMIGLVMVLSLKGKARRGGFVFMIIAAIVIIGSFTLAWVIEPKAITTARAMDIQQAIEDYYQDNGEYPPDLKTLTPGYLPILLGPLTGRGQVWCYQSGADYYRLGYVLFERYHQYNDDTPFYEPYFEIKIPAAAGQPPELSWTCDSELERYKINGGL